MAMPARRRDRDDIDPVIPLRAEFGVLEELEYDPETRHVSMRGLRTACLVRGWTIDDLARIAEVNRGTLYKWDLHPPASRPKDDTLVRVVKALTERRRLDR
jgi:hypothetical protein